MKNIYICCTEDKRLLLEEKARRFGKGKWELTHSMDQAEMLVVVGESRSYQMEGMIDQAKKLGINVEYYNESFIRQEIQETLLSNSKGIKIQAKQPRTERVKGHGQER